MTRFSTLTPTRIGGSARPYHPKKLNRCTNCHLSKFKMQASYLSRNPSEKFKRNRTLSTFSNFNLPNPRGTVLRLISIFIPLRSSKPSRLLANLPAKSEEPSFATFTRFAPPTHSRNRTTFQGYLGLSRVKNSLMSSRLSK